MKILLHLNENITTIKLDKGIKYMKMFWNVIAY